MKRKIKTWAGKKKRERERETKNAHKRGEKRTGIFLLSVEGKREILNLIFNTINC